MEDLCVRSSTYPTISFVTNVSSLLHLVSHLSSSQIHAHVDHNHGSSFIKSDGTIHQLRRRLGQVGPEVDVTSNTIITTSDLILVDPISSSDFVLLAKKVGEDLVKVDDKEEEEGGAHVGPPSYGNDSNAIIANDDNKEEDDAIVGVGLVAVALVAGTDAKVSLFVQA